MSGEGPTRIMAVEPRLERMGRSGSQPPRRGFFRRWFVRLIKVALVLGVLGLLTAAGAYWWFVVQNPGDHLDRSHILSVISQESPVYYADGTTKLGVFFADEHRKYVPFDEIPADFVDGLIAAEDQTFFTHSGFSVQGIGRAFVQNLRAGRVVAGGSTLTQQTAKNLFERRGRTYKEKLRELANGLRLERLYSKEDILEFYSNQFYVNGNGRGLGIAAKFFFDRDDLSELTLVECAFLAGVVKSPNRYNPWVPGEERQARAQLAAKERKDYVVGRMLVEGTVTQAEHDAAIAAEIPFSRGHFRFARSVILDEVERELTRPSFQELLARHGITDLGTSGLQITTTLDAGVQEGAAYALRHHLSDVGSVLEGPELEALFGEKESLRPLDKDRVRPRLFHRGVLVAVDPESRTATVDLGGVIGILDADANTRLARARKRSADRNTWVQASRKDVKKLLEELEPFVDRTTLVSIREVGEDGTPMLDWEFSPELQGAVVVLEGGAIRGMVGGSANADFNRATMARRQLGSTWKPLLFQAALQLRWATTDELDNTRAVFPYQATFYYPRPDHRGAPEKVSIAWASTKSENLASIWLLYHLTDRLNPEQFRQAAALVGLVPGDGDWAVQVQTAGVLPTEGKLREGLFDRLKSDIAVDLVFDARDAEAEALAAMHYGLGFADELDEVRADSSLPKREKQARLGALRRSLLRQEALTARFGEARRTILDRVAEGRPVDEFDLAGFSVESIDGPDVRLSFGDSVPEGYELLTVARFTALASGELDTAVFGDDDDDDDSAEPADPDEAFEPDAPGLDEGIAAGPRGFDVIQLLARDRVLLEGQLTPELMATIRTSIDEARAALGPDVDLYSFDMLALCRDFRTLVGLRYLVGLAQRSGVRSPLDPVLSMPLGSSDITLLEAAQVYEVMLTGSTWRFFADPLAADASLAKGAAPVELQEPYDQRRATPFPDTSIIAQIRMPDGRVLFQAAREELPVQDAALSADVGGFLRTTVSHGTGRRAEGAIRPISDDEDRASRLRRADVRLPVFGKTGTTNSYRNSAFVGMVPTLAPNDDQLGWGHGYVIATYVGYDDNREMKRGSVRIQGASGSLPVWIGTAQASAEASDVGTRADLAELAFSGGRTLPIDWPDTQVPITVDLRTGLPPTADSPAPEGDEEGTTVVYRRRDERAFAPYRPIEEGSRK
ncbi:MAG: hypothetical protein GY898_09630 [Proteobacteria bacterium]|nr:hypothetical protein [Pseudomonadota bacterium]